MPRHATQLAKLLSTNLAHGAADETLDVEGVEDQPFHTEAMGPAHWCAGDLGGQFSSDVAFRVGEEQFAAGRYALGFTVDVGEVFRFFLVDGTASWPLYFEAYELGFEASRLLMQLIWVNCNEARLTWHLGIGPEWPVWRWGVEGLGRSVAGRSACSPCASAGAVRCCARLEPRPGLGNARAALGFTPGIGIMPR